MINLRDLLLEDLFIIKKWRNAQIKVLRQSSLLTDNDQIKYWRRLQESNKEKLFAIECANELIGYCGFVNIDKENKKAEISFLLNNELEEGSERYCNIFYDVLKKLQAIGFVKLDLNRLFTETYSFRLKHILILEKAGMKKEGTLREHVIKDEVFYDSILHGIIRKEFVNE